MATVYGYSSPAFRSVRSLCRSVQRLTIAQARARVESRGHPMQLVAPLDANGVPIVSLDDEASIYCVGAGFEGDPCSGDFTPAKRDHPPDRFGGASTARPSSGRYARGTAIAPGR